LIKTQIQSKNRQKKILKVGTSYAFVTFFGVADANSLKGRGLAVLYETIPTNGKKAH